MPFGFSIAFLSWTNSERRATEKEKSIITILGDNTDLIFGVLFYTIDG